MPKKKYKTEAERHAAIIAAKKRYYLKKKAQKKQEPTETTPTNKVSYATLYHAALNKVKSLTEHVKALTEELEIANTKNAEYERLCKSFAEKEKAAQTALRNTTMEYNARIDYMLDTVKHAYIGMQFAVNASKKEPNND